MKQTFLNSLVAFLCLVSSVFAADVSLIIPCHASHLGFIPELLDTLEGQTRLPDEVIISVSEASEGDKAFVEEICTQQRPYRLEILTTKSVRYAGENRNTAAKKATGEIIITQDADDIPHPQRIEIIEYFLTKTGACHAMHQLNFSEYTQFDEEQPTWVDFYENFDAINFYKIKKSATIGRFSFLTHGCIAVRKDVLQSLQWSNKKKGEDFLFNYSVVNKFHNTILILAPLYLYRNEYSTL